MVGDSRACWKELKRKTVAVYGNVYHQECAEKIYGKGHPGKRMSEDQVKGMRCGQAINQ